jgi:hypothetical protein
LTPPAPSSHYMSPSDYYRAPPVSETPGHSYPGSQNGMYNPESSPSNFLASMPVHLGLLLQDALPNAFADLPSRFQPNQTANIMNEILYQPTTLFRPIAPRPIQAPTSSLENNEDHPYIAEQRSEDEPNSRH